MTPQKETNGSMHEQAGQTYGRYEGDQGQHDEMSYEQLLREEPVGKVYPQPRDNKNILRLRRQ